MSVKFAVLGHGVVGSGVVELFYKNKKSIEKRAGTEMDIKYILDLRDFPDSPYKDKFTKDFNDILNDDEVTSVAECMGGVEPAFTFVKSCLEKGKSVSTSNKELVAEKGDILLQTAKEHNCNFFFEASVGGAIPIIRPLHRCLAANDITKVAGILNGTTNFILTKMYNDNMPFADALKLAQELGYAEKDPTADIEGHDACRKICIISSLVYGKHVYPKSVYTKGITQVELCDVEAADVLGYAIKLVASVTKLDNGKILPSVMPTLVSYDNIMAGVNDVFNAVLVYGDGVDQTMFYGRGAGKLPTASAVLGDVIETAKGTGTVLSQTWESASDDSFIENCDSYTSRWYFRVPADTEVDLGGTYSHDDGISYVTDEEMTFAQAKAKADEIGALAFMPVLE
ncbi:MAG: Homoserine dehydrogenase [Firmicutes bacterium ADurb.BinA205]|nr:MAG: Homoserine dehydrogenase [Firmicutes bacterium ADurb.BinA205]HOC33152.1 homoserine dehydrogenase [Ruminococcus flavefaciens]